MRVLLVTNAARGHFSALLPLALALRVAGHTVRVACPPSLADAVVGNGLVAVPMGSDVSAAPLPRQSDGQPATVDELLDPERLSRPGARFAQFAEAMAEDLIEFARSWQPHLVVSEPTAAAGPLAAAAIGVPAVRHRWGLDLAAKSVIDSVASRFDALYARFGLDYDGAQPDLILDPCPPTLQYPVVCAGTGVRYIPCDGGAVLPSWLREPSTLPRVCLTFGSLAGGMGALDLANAVIEGLSALDVELILAVLPGEQSAVCGKVRIVESFPLHLLVAGCDLVVHHGGSNTMLTALTYGVPQLVLPYIADSIFNADRVQACGVGTWASNSAPDDLRCHASSLLSDPAPRAAARRLGGEMAALPPPGKVVALLEDLAESGKTS